MQLELTTWERIMLFQIVGGLRGPVALIRNAGKLLDILELRDEDAEQIGLVITDRGVVHWRNQERTWQIVIDDRNLATLLTNAVKGFEGWQPGDVKRIEALLAKLGIEGI
jgi:hypothetical protein